MNKILSIAFIAISLHVFGQKTNEIYSDKSVIYSSEDILLKHQYLDSIFYQGKIYFIKAKPATALMNYNLLENGISVVDNAKNVLLLDGLDQILFVSYNGRIFFPYQGSFLEQIDTYKNNVLLLIQRKVTANYNAPTDAFGMNSESASNGKHTSSSGVGNRISQTDLNEDLKVEVKMETEYFILINGMYHTIYRIKDLKKLFPKKKDTILAFVSDNHLNINRIEDLKKIISYCAEDAN
jgi:hypothetical protein